MGKKVLTVIGIIIFLLVLILANFFLKKESEKALSQNSGTVIQKESEESKVDILKVTSENFESEVIQSDQTVLIDFYADWCGPCKMLSPIVTEVAKENPDVKVVKIDVDAEQDLAIEYQVMSIPTLVVIKNGNEVNRVVGLIDKSEILSLIQ